MAGLPPSTARVSVPPEAHLVGVLRAVRNVNQLITREKDRDTLLRRACEILTETRGYRSAWIGLGDAAGRMEVVAESGIGEAFAATRADLEREGWPACARQALGGREIAVLHDPLTNCVRCPLSRSYRDSAALAAVLRHGDRDFGVLVVALPRSVADGEEEQDLFAEVAGDIGFALHKIELHARLEDAEHRVRSKLNALVEQLRQSESKYRLLTETMPDVIWQLDLERRFLYLNSAVERMLGYAAEEMVGQPLDRFFAVERLPEIADIIARVLACTDAPTGVVFETEMIHRSGRAVPVEVHSMVHRDESGAPTGFQGVTRDITGRKRAEDALRSSRQLLEATEWISGFGGWEYGVAAGKITWTDGTYKIHDLDPALLAPGSTEHIERSLACYSPEDRPRIEAAFRRCVEAGDPYDLECDFTTAAGRHLRVRTMARAIREGDRTVSVFGNIQDITAQELAEEALRREHQWLQFVVDGSRLGTWVWNVQTNEIVFNETWAAILGYTLDELMPYRYATWERLVHPDDLAVPVERLRRCAAGEIRDYECEYRMRHKDGHWCWILDRGRVMAHDAAGAPLSMFGTHIDITDRKQSEQALRQSEERFRAANEASLDCILMLRSERDGNGEISDFVFVEVNQRTEAMLRMSREQLLGKRLCEMLPVNREAGFFEKYKRVVETGDPLEEEFLLPETHVPAAWYYHQVVKVGDGVFICHRDISERKRSEEEREKLQAQLLQAQKMESVGRLAGGVAHDFNNLLMGIMGYTELCRDKVAADHSIRPWLDEITHEAERSAGIVRQLLAFSRRQTIAPKLLDLNDAVAGMLKMLHRLIGEDIALAWMPGTDVWPIRCDPGQIDQILANLCVNARDAIAGVGQVTIATATVVVDGAYCAEHAEAAPGEYAILAVSDDGCGMDHETLAHVFEPFFTTKPVGQGTGLGLATIYGIAKQNGGFVTVDSEPGKGTTFRVHLPRQQEAVEATGVAQVPAPQPGGTETIMLVEDEKSILVTTARFLQVLGYTVLDAEAPGDALRLAEQHSGPIHLLITDVVMPGMNGRDLAGKLIETHPDLKVLYMSGYTANVIAHRGVLEEGVHFLAKPFARDILARKVHDVMKGNPTGTAGAAPPPYP